jgi:hypothetical protein
LPERATSSHAGLTGDRLGASGITGAQPHLRNGQTLAVVALVNREHIPNARLRKLRSQQSRMRVLQGAISAQCEAYDSDNSKDCQYAIVPLVRALGALQVTERALPS